MAEGDLELSLLRYDRLCRTERSEAFLVSIGDEPFGRVDLHFGSSVVHGLILVERELNESACQALVERIDEDLVWTADHPRDDFVATLYQGHEIAVFSDTRPAEDDEDDDLDEDR